MPRMLPVRPRDNIPTFGAAWAGHCREPQRVRIAVENRKSRSEAWLTPGQARVLAIKLLTYAERAQRKGATALRIVKTEAKAKDIARELLEDAK